MFDSMAKARLTTKPADDHSLELMVWLSPAFPVGAFAYSHGLEAAVESGDIHDAATLTAWIEDILRHGAGLNDAILLAAAWRAVGADEMSAVNELALALAPSRERDLETRSQGNAFVAAVSASWPCPRIDELRARETGGVAYPVALGVAAAGYGVPLLATLDAGLLAFVSNLVSASVRLGPIGQTEGQGVIARLLPTVRAVSAFAATSSLDDLGGVTMRSDIASMRHETQYSRLFRS